MSCLRRGIKFGYRAVCRRAAVLATLVAATLPTPAAAIDLKEIGADLAQTPAAIERSKSWEMARRYGARTASDLTDPYGRPEYRRIGNFFIINRLDTALVYDSNVYAAPGRGIGDFRVVAAPLLVIRSDLPRHIFDLQLSSRLTRYRNESSLDSDDGAARLAAIFHIDHAHMLSLKSGAELTHEDRLAIGAATNATSLTPILHTYAAAALKRDAGRLWASSGVSFDSWKYYDVNDANGAVVSQNHRDNMQTAVDLKLGYRFSPGFELAGRVKGLRQENRGNAQIDTTAWGGEAIAGVRFEVGPLVRVFLEGGYGVRDYDRPGVETAGSSLLEGRIQWLIAPSLTLDLSVNRSFDDGVTSTTIPGGGSGGRVRQSVAGRLDYWASRNLMFTLGADYLETTFEDGSRVDVRITGKAGVVRHVGRNLRVTLDLEQVSQNSTIPAFDIERTQIRAGAQIRF